MTRIIDGASTKSSNNSANGSQGFDVTGLVYSSRSQIVTEDRFDTGMNGWIQLFTPAQDGSGSPGGTLSRITRGEPRLILRTPSVSNASAMGIKRFGNYYGDGKYLVEFKVSLEQVTMTPDRPRWFGWGIDTCDSNGNRRYFYIRWLNYDETGGTQPLKFQILNSSGAYTDIPNGVFAWQTNENKSLPVYLAFIVNTSTGIYHGFRVNNVIKEGQLNISNPSSTSMSSLGTCQISSLSTFAGGINPFFDIVNRSNATFTGAASHVHWHRLTYLG